MPGDKTNANPIDGKQWVFPGYGDAHTDPQMDDENPDPDTVFQVLPLKEAHLLSIKLESEGIPCSLRKQTDSSESSPEEPMVAVFVRQTHFDEAREVASKPLRKEDPEDQKQKVELLVDRWICPSCGRRELNLLPPSRGWQRIRFLSLLLIVVPVLLFILLLAFPSPTIDKEIDAMNLHVWFCFGLVLAIALIFGTPRDRGCKSCGWRSDQPQRLEDGNDDDASESHPS